MPQIQPYEDHISAQGAIGTRASAADFGGQVGGALQGLGGAVENVGQNVYDVAKAEDVTKVHVNMAKAREEWTQNLQDRTDGAKPGDKTFAPTLMKDMGEYFAKGAESAQTREGKQLWTAMSANMASEFGQRAIGIQATLAGEEAVNQRDILLRSSGNTVFKDPSQLATVIANGKAAIDDPNSIFAHIPAPMREKYKATLEQNACFAMVSGIVRRNPPAVLGSIAPEQLQQFKPWQGIMDANVAPGGRVNISAGTQANAKEFVANATATALNPNILMAQHDLTPPGSQQTPEAQAKDMSVLVNKYGGDYSKGLAAYNLGTQALDRLLNLHGSNWFEAVPADTQQYVSTVLENSGAVASSAPQAQSPVPPVPPEPRTPVNSTIDAMNKLTWEQQDHIIKEGVQLQHMRMTMAIHARQEAEYQRGQIQEASMNSGLQKIVAPDKYGTLTEKDILDDKTLDQAHKQHLIDYMFTRQRELKAGRDSKTNPEEVRRLLLQVYANPDDPNKTYSMDPAMESYRTGRISTAEMMLVRREVDGLRDGSTGGFQKMANNASNVVHDAFTKSIEGQVQPAKAAEGWYRFKFDMDQQIQQKREKNEDPRVLLDPSSREYLLKPERLQTFMGGAATTMKEGAGKVIQGAQQPAPNGAKVLPSYTEYDSLKSGTEYVDPNGKIRIKG